LLQSWRGKKITERAQNPFDAEEIYEKYHVVPFWYKSCESLQAFMQKWDALWAGFGESQSENTVRKNISGIIWHMKYILNPEKARKRSIDLHTMDMRLDLIKRYNQSLLFSFSPKKKIKKENLVDFF
jgi:hypothetical protein